MEINKFVFSIDDLVFNAMKQIQFQANLDQSMLLVCFVCVCVFLDFNL